MTINESYSVTIKLENVKDADDLLLQLIRTAAIFERFPRRFWRLTTSLKPIALSRKGTIQFGTAEAKIK